MAFVVCSVLCVCLFVEVCSVLLVAVGVFCIICGLWFGVCVVPWLVG